MYRTLLLLAVITLSGCLHHGYYVSGTTPAPEPAHSAWRTHLFVGIVDADDDVDLRAICPQGVARVEDYVAPLNGLVSLLTALIYTPSTLRVYCVAEMQPPSISADHPTVTPPVPEGPTLPPEHQ